MDARNKSGHDDRGGDGGGRPHRAPMPPAVTPALSRGPDCQAPLSPGFPGPRNKSG